MRYALVPLLMYCLAWAPAPAVANELQLVGAARLKVLFWPVYDSRLYAVDGRYQPGELPLRLEIEYLRDIPAAQLVSRTAEEWQSIGLQHPQQQDWLQQLESLWPDIARNDVLVLEVNEGSSRFYHNGRALGAVDDADFGEHFLAIWLSPKTSRPALRAQLLGAAD